MDKQECIKRAQMEGALGYAARIGDLLQQKVTLEQLGKVLAEDAATFSAALGVSYKSDLALAICPYGTFELSLEAAKKQ